MLVFLGKISTMMHQSERIVGRGETANKMREGPRLNYFVDGNGCAELRSSFFMRTYCITTHCFFF